MPTDSSSLDLLVCAATEMELRTFGERPQVSERLPRPNTINSWGEPEPEKSREEDEVNRAPTGFSYSGPPELGREGFLTGAGIPVALGQTLTIAGRIKPARILNIGIAGAYPGSGLAIGDIVIGESEVYGDVGMELPESPGFQHVREMPWGALYLSPQPLTVFPEFAGAATGRGCTVNSCTGTEATGRLRERLFDALFETMEGAAVAQAGQLLDIPVCEIRAISNIASKRDMRPENIQIALHSLTAYFQKCRGALR